MSPEEAAREVRRIEITTRHLVRDIVAGEYSSAFRGRGVEFAEVREYQPGDDIRTIDWNVTARLGSAYVKRYLEERELSVLFVVDLSASGGFGSTRRTKGELGAEVAAVLALAAARNNDRIGGMFFTDRVEYHLHAAKGRRHVLRLISDLLTFAPEGTGTDLGLALAELEPTLRRRAIIFVLSDFMTTGYEAVLGRIARRHDVVGLQLIDPRERALPAGGIVTLWDPETGAWRRIDTGDARVRAHFTRRTGRVRPRPGARAARARRRPAAARDRTVVRGAAADVFPAAGADVVAMTDGRASGRAAADGQAVGRSDRLGSGAGVPRRRSLGWPRSALHRRWRRSSMGSTGTSRPRLQRATVGDTITVNFRVRLDERDLLFDTVPRPAVTPPDWVRVFSVDKLERQPDRIFLGRARIAFYRPGLQQVPIFQLPFMRSVKGLSRGTFLSDSAAVEIVPVLQAGASATLRDIKEPVADARPEPAGAAARSRRARRRRLAGLAHAACTGAPSRRSHRLRGQRARCRRPTRTRWRSPGSRRSCASRGRPAMSRGTTRRSPTRCATTSRRTACPRVS